MKKTRKVGMFVTAAVSLAFMQGCSHAGIEKHIDEQLAQEPDVKTQKDLRAESATMIENAPGLTQEQRQRLLDLKAKTAGQLDPLGEQSLKLRAILVKDLISTPYNEDEVELIKVRLRTIGDRRLSVMFDAVKEANLILGRQAMANQKVVNDVLFEGRGSRD